MCWDCLYANYDRTPVGYSLYERYAVGFMDEPPVISSPGNMTLDPLPLLTACSGYRINTPVDNEFFLLENRQQAAFKWDAFLPGSGMLVHRVDKTKTSVWDYNTVNTILILTITIMSWCGQAVHIPIRIKRNGILSRLLPMYSPVMIMLRNWAIRLPRPICSRGQASPVPTSCRISR